MANLPANTYIEHRDGGYYIAGTRIGLDVIVWTYRHGSSPGEIFEAFPSLGSLSRTNEIIEFILQHPEEIECYLREVEELWEKFKREHPLPEDMLERLRRGREELTRRSA